MDNFGSLKEEQQSKLILSSVLFRLNHKECITVMVDKLRIFAPNNLISIIARFIKSPMS